MYVTDTEFAMEVDTNSGISGLFDFPVSVAPSGTSGLERFICHTDCVIDIVFYNRMKRVENCGKVWQYNRKKASGVRSLHSHTCGDYHNCDICLNTRVYKVKKRLEPICMANELYMLTITPADWRNMRKITPGAINFYVCPQADDTVVAFINQTMFDNLQHTKYVTNLQPVTESDFNNKINWNEILMTPEYPVRKRVSGKLGESESEIIYGEICERGVIITRDGEMVDEYEVQEIDNEAMDATSELDPHTIIELQVAMDTRTDAFIAAAKAHNCEVKIVQFMGKVTIAPNSLHWLHSYTLIVASRKRIAQRRNDFKSRWSVSADLGT